MKVEIHSRLFKRFLDSSEFIALKRPFDAQRHCRSWVIIFEVCFDLIDNDLLSVKRVRIHRDIRVIETIWSSLTRKRKAKVFLWFQLDKKTMKSFCRFATFSINFVSIGRLETSSSREPTLLPIWSIWCKTKIKKFDAFVTSLWKSSAWVFARVEFDLFFK